MDESFHWICPSSGLMPSIVYVENLIDLFIKLLSDISRTNVYLEIWNVFNLFFMFLNIYVVIYF